MATKSKGGRPPRAKGEKMHRLSVVVRQKFRESLDLIARDRRTSLSQALEFVIATVARDYDLKGVSALQIGELMAELEDDSVGRLARIAVIPEHLLGPAEEFIRDVLVLLGGLPDVTDDEARLLLAAAAEAEMAGRDPAFAISVWRKACDAVASGQSEFDVVADGGDQYKFDIQGPMNGYGQLHLEKVPPASRDAFVKQLEKVVTRNPSLTSPGPLVRARSKKR